MPNRPIYLALSGLFIWLLFTLAYWPSSPLSLDYVRILLIAAPLAIVPLCAQHDGINGYPILLLATLFGWGMLLPSGWLAALLVLPWWLFSGWLIYRQWAKRFPASTLSQLLALAPAIYLWVAACWALADRLDLEPMGFSADITLLTAVHFHYAGFTLNWLAAKLPGGPIWMKWGILLGVALVAVGITASQYNLPAEIEVVSVSLLAIAALRFAWHLIRSARGWSSIPALIGALALSGGMILALCYGWRYYFPIPALNIPSMYAIHGSLNSLGFALPTVWALTLLKKERSATPERQSLPD